MEQARKPKAGDIYRHFKDKLYEITAIAIHAETEEEMVVYKQMYGSFQTYVSPLSMFLSEVDHERYPDSRQRHYFERVGALSLEEADEEKKPAKEEEGSGKPDAEASGVSEAENAMLLFLDARSYGEKLSVLEEIGSEVELDDRIINNMAISVDLVIAEGSPEDRLAELRDCLRTKARFECFRLH